MDPQNDEEIIDDESEIEDDSDIEGVEDIMDEEDKNRAQAFSVKNQLIIWDMLINTRIKLQKTLLASNKLPQHNQFGHYMDIGGEEVKKAQSKALQEESKLIESVSKLNNLLTSKGVDQVKIGDNPSSEKQLASNHNKLLSNVNGIINDWWQKTNYATRSSKANAKSQEEDQSSIIDNINSILINRERLIKKTRTRRSQYNIIGKADEDSDGAKNEEKEDQDEGTKKNHEEIIDCEIFDDDDFYGQLLRHLIESKTSLDSVDPISLSRQWLEVQKIRKKMQRRIDTRASKGRRLRYQVHQPLISFMAPIEDCPYDDRAKDALFASLFNQRKNQSTDS